MAKFNRAALVRKYRDEYGMDMPTKKLARIVYDENILLFKDSEDARNALRAIEGKSGTRTKTTHPYPERPKNPYKLPESDEESFEHFYIKGFKTGLIINDLHIPYHNQVAITTCFNYAKKKNPDFIFINGDLNDFHSVSYFLKDPRKKRFSEEIEMACDFLEILKSTFKCKIFFKFGNHEERYDNFLFQKAHELKGLDEFELENIYKSRVPDIEVIKDKRVVLINGLPFIHGHEFGRSIFSPVNASRGLQLRAKHSAVKADCHTTSEHSTKDILSKFMTTFSVGCLCGLTPKWLPLNEWNHGFAMIYLHDNGEDYEFENKRILDDRVL